MTELLFVCATICAGVNIGSMGQALKDKINFPKRVMYQKFIDVAKGSKHPCRVFLTLGDFEKYFDFGNNKMY